MNPSPYLDSAQFDALLKAVQAIKSDSYWHWQSAVPIFISSFLGLLTGICLDILRRRLDHRKTGDEKRKKELQQIKCALIGIGYNIQTLTHLAAQNLLPHHAQSENALTKLRQICNEREALSKFAQSLHEFPALMMTCPPLYFVEYDFLEKLPFLTEKDPNIVMDSARQIELSRRVRELASERNRHIELGRSATMPTGALSLPQLDTIIRTQDSLSLAECVACIDLLEAFQETARSLEKIISAYGTNGSGTKLIMPPAINEVILKLQSIREKAISRMPDI